MTSRQVKSWNRFAITHLGAQPDVMGHEHHFHFNQNMITVKLPQVEQADRGGSYDEVASVKAWSADGKPLYYEVYKVDVETSGNVRLEFPLEVLNRPPNALDLFSKEEQAHLNEVGSQYQSIAERALEYWVRIVRWTCDDFRISRDRGEGFYSGWTIRLVDVETGKRVWIPTAVFLVSAYRTVSLKEWEDIQQRLSDELYPSVYIEHKHDAEEYIERGDYRRAIVDLAAACELFLRVVVLRSLPAGLRPALQESIDSESISQYFNRFFPKAISEAARREYNKKQYNGNNMKRELASLFSRRNGLLHAGKDDGVNRQICERFLKMTKDLLGLQELE
jgi:hypothetical protein